jgi:hypothetical protein
LSRFVDVVWRRLLVLVHVSRRQYMYSLERHEVGVQDSLFRRQVWQELYQYAIAASLAHASGQK